MKADPEAEAGRLAWRAWALYGAGNLAIRQSDFQAGLQAASESLQLFKQLHDGGATAWPLVTFALEALHRKDYSRARQLFRESVTAGIDTPHGHAIAAMSVAYAICPGIPGVAWPGEDVICQERSLAEVIAAAEEALRTAEAGGETIAVCWSLLILGGLHGLRRDYARRVPSGRKVS